MERFKQIVRTALAGAGLLHASRELRAYMTHGARGLRHHRMLAARPQRAAAFAARYGEVFRGARSELKPDASRVLIIGGASPSRVEMGLCLVKSLELAGWRPMHFVAEGTGTEKQVSTYYALFDSMMCYRWDDYFPKELFRDRARSVVEDAGSLEELLAYRTGNVRVGGHAVATARRKIGIGALDLKDKSVRARLIVCFQESMVAAEGAERAVRELRPALVLIEDTAYTPGGQILDVCAGMGVPLIRWYTAHKTDALMLKRYTASNRDQDLNSLSDASWRAMREMNWDEDRAKELDRELTIGYTRKGWYNEDGAQFNKRCLDRDAIRKRLGLDPLKKTAIVFPHVAYDASFGRGEDLFPSYDEWLIESVKAACSNRELRWIVRVHPGNAGKHDGYGRRMPDEGDLLRARFGHLPKHVTVIPARSDISTLSLFSAMDYCVTVRGTVGIEAACRGIPVLTGGSGRYDRKGFTIDSATPEEYAGKLGRLQDIPRLSPAQIELARRFAYGLFLLRPLPLSSMTMIYDKEFNVENLGNPVDIRLRSKRDWEEAPDLRAFADWAANSSEEDFLLQPSGRASWGV